MRAADREQREQRCDEERQGARFGSRSRSAPRAPTRAPAPGRATSAHELEQQLVVGDDFVPAQARAACCTLFAWLLWPRAPAVTAAAPGRLMVAVLPFQNLTGDAAQDYFSDGLTEEMIAQLGRADPQHLGVIARTSVMQYRNEKAPLAQIGRELGVQYVLEGSVRRDSTRVRITVALVKVRDQASVWSRQYDRALSGLLDLQREIAREITRGTELTVQGGRAPLEAGLKPVTSPNSYEAYDLYLKGRDFWNKRTMDGFQRAAGFFQQAIARDSNYARAGDCLRGAGCLRTSLQRAQVPRRPG